MAGLLPPSWSSIFVICGAHVAATRRPTADDPVNEKRSTPACPASSVPVSPKPVITLITPGGIPASRASCATPTVVSEPCSDGFRTMVQPAASARPTSRSDSRRGLFDGVIAPTTPIGSRRVYTWTSGCETGIVRPSIRIGQLE